jgi:hypothetical protein
MRSSLKEPAHLVQVNRQDILHSEIANYMLVDNLTSVTVEFSGEVGEDQCGLTRDMFASFWEEQSPSISEVRMLLSHMSQPWRDKSLRKFNL